MTGELEKSADAGWAAGAAAAAGATAGAVSDTTGAVPWLVERQPGLTNMRKKATT
jgi:hypothetical protein